eukprot:NODE_10618_length_1339_cov_8.997525.p2 GENE.NODE_10618_length_1339_cov_8.997525~~NODE_10618_length_1339_cov_8.997525.p2  ORF type:complete len:100 (-),score=46.72 NODE_10618_length_1339_cov_8.997525:81-380(-)
MVVLVARPSGMPLGGVGAKPRGGGRRAAAAPSSIGWPCATDHAGIRVWVWPRRADAMERIRISASDLKKKKKKKKKKTLKKKKTEKKKKKTEKKKERKK